MGDYGVADERLGSTNMGYWRWEAKHVGYGKCYAQHMGYGIVEGKQCGNYLYL